MIFHHPTHCSPPGRPCLEPEPLFLVTSILILSSHLHLSLPSSLFRLCVRMKILCFSSFHCVSVAWNSPTFEWTLSVLWREKKSSQKSPIKKSYNLFSRTKCHLIAATPLFSVANMLRHHLTVLLQMIPPKHVIWILDVAYTYFDNTRRTRTATSSTTNSTWDDVEWKLVLPGETSAARPEPWQGLLKTNITPNYV